jgi:hypothetical protein
VFWASAPPAVATAANPIPNQIINERMGSSPFCYWLCASAYIVAAEAEVRTHVSGVSARSCFYFSTTLPRRCLASLCLGDEAGGHPMRSGWTAFTNAGPLLLLRLPCC